MKHICRIYYTVVLVYDKTMMQIEAKQFTICHSTHTLSEPVGDKRQSMYLMSHTCGHTRKYMHIYVKPSTRSGACPHVHGE